MIGPNRNSRETAKKSGWHDKKPGNTRKGARQNSSLLHKCGVPTLTGTPHLCGSKRLGKESVLHPTRNHGEEMP
jgi:hypothetical protein